MTYLKVPIVAEAEAVENNSEIAREYGISESMVRRWRKDQENLLNGEIKPAGLFRWWWVAGDG